MVSLLQSGWMTPPALLSEFSCSTLALRLVAGQLDELAENHDGGLGRVVQQATLRAEQAGDSEELPLHTC